MPGENGNIRLGVDGLGQFQRDLSNASNAVKNLGSASKLADSELRKTGDTQQYVQQKTAALTQQIEAQQRAVEAAAAGLREAAAAYGENSREAQQWQAKLNNAKTGLNNLTADLNSVQGGTDRLSQGFRGASKAAQEHSSMVKNINYQTFMGAVDRVEGKLKSMAQTAKRVGQQIWNSARESSDWADTLATDASRYGIDTRTLQQWQYAANFVDVEASTIAGSMNKLFGQMRSSSAESQEAFKSLGISVRASSGSLADVQNTFWKVIDGLSDMTDETQRDALAQQLFGKSFTELRPLIDAGRDSWEAYCDEAERAGLVLSDEQVGKLTSFNDSLQRMDASLASLKNGAMAALAPGFEKIADTVGDATGKLIEWMNSTEGQEALGNMADMISDIVQSIADTDLTTAINVVTEGIRLLGDAAKWASENADGLWNAFKWISGLAVGGKVLLGGAKAIKTIGTIGRTLGLGGGAAAAGGGAAAAGGGGAASGIAGGVGTGLLTTIKAIPGAVAKGVATAATSTVGTGLIGFTGGMAAVLGVGLLAKAMAGEAQLSDFGMGQDKTAYNALVERNRIRNEANEARHQETVLSGIRGTSDAITAAIEDLKAQNEQDWRTREARERLGQMTAEDLAQAIEDARNRSGGEGERKPTEIEVKVGEMGDAVEAALHDNKITKHEIEAVQRYIDETFTPAIEEAVKLVDGGWQTVEAAMNNPPSKRGDNKTGAKTEVEVLEFSAMSQWVQDMMGGEDGDLARAKKEAEGLWIQLLTAAGSPGQLQADLQQTAEEAKASGNNQTWNAMVEWVKNTMGLDQSAAEQKVSQMWQQLGTYATAAQRHPELNNEYKPDGTQSTVFQNYVEGMFKSDYTTAKATLDGWLEDLDKAVERHNANPTGEQAKVDGEAPGVNGSTYLTDKIAELVVVKGQIQEISDAIALAVAQGIDVDPAALQLLQQLMDRAEGLSQEVGWYAEEEQVKGRGAMGLAMEGVDYENMLPLALKYIEDVYNHEMEGITQGIEDAKRNVGTTRADWAAASGTLRDLERAYELTYGPNGENAPKEGQEGYKEYEAATKELQEARQAVKDAEQAYKDAQAKYEEETATEATRRAAVERERADNLAEVSRGAAKVVGYDEGGKYTYVEVKPEETEAGQRKPAKEFVPGMPEHQRAAEQSGYAMGSVKATSRWVNPWAGAEAGERLMQMVAGLSPQQVEMADQLFDTYGSFSAFMDALGPKESAEMQAILDRTKGTSAEGDFWNTMMYRAFGRTPDNQTGQTSVQSLAFPDQTAAWQWIAAMINFKPKERSAADVERERQAQAQAQADALNAQYAELVAQGNETSGYNAFKAAVREQAEAGMFKGVDWSTIDGGAVESVLADLAKEAEEAGMEVSEGYGTGMESGQDRVVNAASAVGAEGPEAIKEAAQVNSPSRLTIETGKFIAEGLVLGMESGSGMVAAAAQALARQAIEAMRAELDIHSPSRVMTGLGEFTGQGFAMGIEDSVGSVMNAMDSIIEATRAPVEAYAMGGGASGNSFSSNAAIYIDNYHQNSAEDVGYIRDQLAGMQQRELHGFGLRR